MSTVSFLRVRSGAQRFGLPLEHLVEVLETGATFPVPVAEPALRGLMEVRGRLLPLVHLAGFISGTGTPARAGEVAILVAAGGRELCFEVDEAETVAAAELVTGRADEHGAWTAGLLRDETGLLPLLDVPGLVGRLTESGVQT